MALVAALLFLAVCAYIGAGLFQRLSPETLTVRAELFSALESAEISGIAIRNEICDRGILDTGSTNDSGISMC